MPAKVVCFSGNPALDRRLALSSLRAGEVNRARTAESMPGGKAAHVAIALVSLGWKPVWTGFLGGALGKECAAGLRGLGIEVVSLETSSPTRVNLELIEDRGAVTEVLEPGAAPSQKEQAQAIELCAARFRNEWNRALLVISGSLPPGMHPDFYSSLIRIARAAGSSVFLDTSGEWLLNGLEAKPDFVKINAKEAEVLLSPLADRRQFAASAARELIKRGAVSAAITMGKEGLLWMEGSNGGSLFAQPPPLECRSQVGCGDTTFAGFAHATLSGMPASEKIRFATACGAANCLAHTTSRILLAQVQLLSAQIRIEPA